MSGPNVPAFIPVMSTRASAPIIPIAKETLSADNAKNWIQLLFLNVAMNEVINISIPLSVIILHRKLICIISPIMYLYVELWHYRLWSFKSRDTKLERFLQKNQHTQRKLWNFENWTNGEPQ